MNEKEKKDLKELLRRQKEYLDRKMSREKAIREYQIREQQKFANVSIIDLLHKPKNS